MGSPHLKPALVAQTLGHGGGAVDVGEEEGDGAVRGSVATQIRPLHVHGRGKGIDGGLEVGRVDAAPGSQFPNLRLHRACLDTDLREDRHRLLEMRHRVLRPAHGMQQVGYIVVQRRLTVPVALRGA